MKKNMIKVAFVAAIAMVCGIGFMNSQKSETLSEVALANVKALASAGLVTDICVSRPGGECWDLIVTPTGNYTIVWYDMVNKIDVG